MARRFVRRGNNGKINGAVKWPNPDFPEEIDDETNQDYLDWVAEQNAPPPDTRPSKGQASGNSIPTLRADVDAIWQALEDAGIVK